MDVALLYSRLQVGYRMVDGIKFEYNDIIPLYKKNNSEWRWYDFIKLLDFIETFNKIIGSNLWKKMLYLIVMSLQVPQTEDWEIFLTVVAQWTENILLYEIPLIVGQSIWITKTLTALFCLHVLMLTIAKMLKIDYIFPKNGVLVADDAFPLKNYILKPFGRSNNLSRKQKNLQLPLIASTSRSRKCIWHFGF